MNIGCRTKRCLVLSIFAVMIVSLLLFICYYFSGSTIEEIQPVYDPELVIAAQERGCVCLGSDDKLYSLSENGYLRGTDVDIRHVSRMLPVGDGIAYIKGESLYYSLQGENTEISQDVQTFGSYGSHLTYACNDIVYLWQNKLGVVLADLTEEGVRTLLGNEEFLVIMCKSSIFIYQEACGLWEAEVPTILEAKAFLYRSSLVLVGVGENSAIVYDLENRCLYPIDFGWKYSEHNYSHEISVASDGSLLYASYRSKVLPKFANEILEYTATFCIDPENWSTEVISESYYPAIVCGADGLYSLDVFKQRGKLICPA